jgi:hypothetical protein
MKTLRQSWLLVLFVLGSTVATSAAECPTTLAGLVRDLDSAPIPGAMVIALGPDGKHGQVTDASGEYEFLDLPPGTYRVRAVLDGFLEACREDVVLECRGAEWVSLRLEAAFGGIIDARKREIPLTRCENCLPVADELPTWPGAWEAGDRALFLFKRRDGALTVQSVSLPWAPSRHPPHERRACVCGAVLRLDRPLDLGCPGRITDLHLDGNVLVPADDLCRDLVFRRRGVP